MRTRTIHILRNVRQRRLAEAFEDGYALHFEPVQLGIMAGISNVVCLLRTHVGCTEKMTMLSMVVRLMSSTLAMPTDDVSDCGSEIAAFY